MSELLFHQLFEPESSTYTYILADSQTREAVIIDPVLETFERDYALIRELNYKLLFSLETHLHADHVTGAHLIRNATGARIAIGRGAGVLCADRQLKENDLIKFGAFTLKVLETPGHTDGCLSFYVPGKVFTGDSLMIGAAGRTDFQHGSPETLFESISEKLFKLPPETLVYPAHDYQKRTHSTLQIEKESNARIAGKSKTEFVEIMKNLNLAPPKKIQTAVPANLLCGDISRSNK